MLQGGAAVDTSSQQKATAFVEALTDFDKRMNQVVVDSGILQGIPEGRLTSAGASLLSPQTGHKSAIIGFLSRPDSLQCLASPCVDLAWTVLACPALALPRPALPCPALPCPALPCPCPALPWLCPALPCPAQSCSALLRPALPLLCPALPCPTLTVCCIQTGEQIGLQPGCLTVLSRAQQLGVPTHVLSVNYSSQMVKAALQRGTLKPIIS